MELGAWKFDIRASSELDRLANVSIMYRAESPEHDLGQLHLTLVGMFILERGNCTPCQSEGLNSHFFM
jgi:hypothetical protein